MGHDRDTAWTIPSSFIKLDTNINAANSFINVRDAQVQRKNHNILVAQRIQQNTFAFCIGKDDTDSFDSSGYDYINGYGLNSLLPPIILDETIMLSQHTQKVRMVAVASHTTLNGSSTLALNPKLFFQIYNPKKNPTVEDRITPVSVSTSDGSQGAHAVLVPVPHEYNPVIVGGREMWRLRVMLQSRIDSTHALDTAVAVVEVGDRWIDISSGGSLNGDGREMVYIVGKTHIEPRHIIHVEALASGNYRLVLDADWTGDIVPGTDTATVREVLGVRLFSLSGIEQPITDFALIKDSV